MTKILAIDTSLRHGSVALALDGEIISSRLLPRETRSAQSLAPAVKEILAEHAWLPGQLDALGVTIGPGSFTGVRVGVTFAKVFCYAANVPIVGLTSLELIAAQAKGVDGELHVVLDAQRSDLFQQAFRIEEGVVTAISEPSVLRGEQWLRQVAEIKTVAVSGAGLAKFREHLPQHVKVVEEQCWEPSALTLALLAQQAFVSGRRDDAWKILPLYLRASAAEEKTAPN